MAMAFLFEDQVSTLFSKKPVSQTFVQKDMLFHIILSFFYPSVLT
jgi:hypothetical protein